MIAQQYLPAVVSLCNHRLVFRTPDYLCGRPGIVFTPGSDHGKEVIGWIVMNLEPTIRPEAFSCSWYVNIIGFQRRSVNPPVVGVVNRDIARSVRIRFRIVMEHFVCVRRPDLPAVPILLCNAVWTAPNWIVIHDHGERQVDPFSPEYRCAFTDHEGMRKVAGA